VGPGKACHQDKNIIFVGCGSNEMLFIPVSRPLSLALGCDTKSHIWLIGEEKYLFDQSQRSPAGTLGGMLAARSAVGMKPF